MQRALAQLNHMPLRLIPLVLILVLVFSIIGPGVARADPGWYDTDWDYRKKITLESDYISGSSNLTSFPVLISIVDTDLASDALDNGYDILFTAGDEVTKLHHEIESFNGTSGQLVAWVKIPSLSSSVDTDIYMYYGYAGASNQQDATNVWDSNFKMVQHLEESSGGTNAIIDSTANSNNGTDVNTPTLGATGQMDGAISFSGASAQYINSGNDSTLNITTENLTIEAWIYYTSTMTNKGIVAKYQQGIDPQYILYLDGSGTLTFTIQSGPFSATASTASAPSSNNWHHVVGVYDDSTARVYLDGVETIGDANVGDLNSTTAIVTIGSWWNNSSSYSFTGIIDEVRISSSARSADWITTSYNNQNNPSTFITLGPEIGTPSVTTNTATSVEETSALLRGTLDDDGGEASEYRFQYGTTSGVYTLSTAWTGSINNGASFNATISSLNEGDVYYFIAEARNNAGTGSGSEQNFLTKPLEPTSFTATTASSSQINLSWTKGTGADKTMVRGKEGSYPTSITDGYQVYFDTGTSASDTGLLPSTTYYYSAWSEVTGSTQYSDAYAQANATTTSGAPTVVGGLVLPVNKATVLAPWLILSLIVSLVITRIILNFRKGRSSSYS